MVSSSVTENDYQILASALDYLERHKYKYMYRDWSPTQTGFYDWQMRYIDESATKGTICLCAGNQVGKTSVGAYVDAIHLLGDYPDDWKGRKFEHAPVCWLLGVTGEKVRDLLQLALFGRRIDREFTGGLIPRERILHKECEPMQGTKNSFRTIPVKHSSGDVSICKLWGYSQGQSVLMGDVVDLVHLDEEPKDAKIYPQLVTRLLNGDKGMGGLMLLTFTPENGMTELVESLRQESENHAFIQVGWDDAPHMTKEKQKAALASLPTNQHDMRSKGFPMLGHGRVFDVSYDYIACDPFEIPDHWYVIIAIDFGWTHPQSIIKIAENRDEGEFYVVNQWSGVNFTPDMAWGAVKRWSESIPVAWPHDGYQHDKSGNVTKDLYKDAGFKMLGSSATFTDGSRGVEDGNYSINDLMKKGKWKVFRSCGEKYSKEFMQYHRDEGQKIVKKADDIMDSQRYAFMMMRYAVQVGNIGVNKSTHYSSNFSPFSR